MRAVAILTAAGSGTRLGSATPKAFVELGGVPILVRAAQALVASDVVRRVVVTVPPGVTRRNCSGDELTRAVPSTRTRPP